MGYVVWPKWVVRAQLALIVCRDMHPRQVLIVQGGMAILLIVRSGSARASGCTARGVYLPYGSSCRKSTGLCDHRRALNHLAGTRFVEVIFRDVKSQRMCSGIKNMYSCAFVRLRIRERPGQECRSMVPCSSPESICCTKGLCLYAPVHWFMFSA